jgi:hypothetical protein
MLTINKHKAVPITMLLIAVAGIIFPLIEERQLANTEKVELEKLACLKAVCIEEAAVGRACREIPKQLGVIRLIKNFDNMQLVVELTGKHCQ